MDFGVTYEFQLCVNRHPFAGSGFELLPSDPYLNPEPDTNLVKSGLPLQIKVAEPSSRVNSYSTNTIGP